MSKKMYRVGGSLSKTIWLLLLLSAGWIDVIATGGALPGAGLVESELSKLSEARSKLEGEKVALQKGVVGYRRVRVGRRRFEDVPVIGLLGREVALALLDKEGRFHIIRGVKRDNHGFETLTPGYTLSLRKENGINSEFECLNPPGGRILAIKYPVLNEKGRFGGNADVIEATYVPYSFEVESPVIVKHGLGILDGFIEKAYHRLKDRGVRSSVFEERRVVDVIPRETIRVLLINEHIDPGDFRSQEMAAPLSRRVLTVIGGNEEKAYAYSVSSAGARGLVQMIASTYRLLIRKYPNAGLIQDFSAGMGDPVNAVMAQILLCDSDWAVLQPRFPMGQDQVGPYLAAAYNGGVSRVLSLLASGQEEWMAKPNLQQRPSVTVQRRIMVRGAGRRGRMRKRYVTKSYVVPIFRSETSKYVGQYHWIRNYLDSWLGHGKEATIK